VLGCDASPPIEQRVADAPIVFVGTITTVADDGRLATVDVIRIWRGGPLPRQVEVRGTVATQSKVHTALDRIYAKGATYLFVPTAGATPRFIENQCSSTTPLTRELSALAPPGGGVAPTGEAELTTQGRDLSKVLPLAIGGVAFAVLGSLLLAARRKDKEAAGAPR